MKLYSVILFLAAFNTLLLAQWVKTDFNDSKVLLCVDFSGNDGVLGGWHTGFLANGYYTTDRGLTWQPASVPDSLRVIVDLQMINDTLIYACGAKNKIMGAGSDSFNYNELLSDWRNHKFFSRGLLSELRNEQYRAQFIQSTDKGHSWQYKGLLEDTVSYLVDLQFISENTGYTLAHNDSSSGLLKTTDGGNTWDWSYLPASSYPYSFSFLDSLNGFIAGADTAGGLIAQTTDGGLTWTNSVMNGMLEISKIKCIPPSTIVASGLDINLAQKIFISSDYGSSWNVVYSHPNMMVDGIDGLPGGWIIFYGTYYPTGSSSPFVNGTTDMGQSWVESSLSPLTNIVMTGSKMIDSNNWYITGSYMLTTGFLLYTDHNITYTEDSRPDNINPVELSLPQNYPNPFNPSTSIKYSVAEEGLVSLSVYNLLGQKVAELRNEVLQHGYYETEFDASELSSGIYVYKMSAGGKVISRKMILLK